MCEPTRGSRWDGEPDPEDDFYDERQVEDHHALTAAECPGCGHIGDHAIGCVSTDAWGDPGMWDSPRHLRRMNSGRGRAMNGYQQVGGMIAAAALGVPGYEDIPF